MALSTLLDMRKLVVRTKEDIDAEIMEYLTKPPLQKSCDIRGEGAYFSLESDDGEFKSYALTFDNGARISYSVELLWEGTASVTDLEKVLRQIEAVTVGEVERG